MLPVIWKIPGLGIEITGYGVALMVGFLLSISWATKRAARSGANPDIILNCGFLALIGGIVGARGMYVYHYWDELYSHHTSVVSFISDFFLGIQKGGLEVYGGFITVVVLVLGYLLLRRHSIRWYLDIMAPSAALGMAIGRIGCFCTGCCFGGTCDLPWAVRFPYGSLAQRQQWTERRPGAELPQQLLVTSPDGVFSDGSVTFPVSRESLRVTEAELAAVNAAQQEALKKIAELRAQAERSADPKQQAALNAALRSLNSDGSAYFDVRRQMQVYGLSLAELREIARPFWSLPVHPTQLYSVVTLGLLAALLNALYWRRTRDGQVILTMLLVEPWTRWVLEILRADNPVDVAGFTVSQFLGLWLSALGLVGLIALRFLPARSPRAVWWVPPPEPVPAKAGAKGR